MDKEKMLMYVIEQLQNIEVKNLESICIDSDDMADGSSIYIRLYLDDDLQAKHARHREIEK